MAKAAAKTAEERKRQIVTEFRRGEILEAAAKVFGDKGFEGTRMDDIAAEAGLAKATVYVYFDSKDEIYEATVEQALKEITALTEEQIALAKDFAGRLRAFVTVRLSYWREKHLLYRVISSMNREMLDRKRSLKWRKPAVDDLITLFREAAERKEIPQQNFEAAAWALMDMIRGIHERRIARYEDSPEGEIEQLMGFMLRALGYEPGLRKSR